MSAPDEPKSDEAAELNRLRSQVVAQARELIALRSEVSLLASQSAAGKGLSIEIWRRFPGLARRISQASRAARKALAARARLSPSADGPVLAIGDSDVARRVAADKDAGTFVCLSPAAGPTRSLPVQQIDEPPLRRPADGSLVKWLVEDGSRLRQFDTIVAAAADEVSLGLLRGRLVDGQTLILTCEPGQRMPENSTLAELGRANLDAADYRAYRDLPASWLDPLDEQGGPVPAIVGRTAWPKISVVMVSYNQARFLEEGLRSVLDQGYPNLELIVIDGNSTDGSVDILNRYRDRAAATVIEPDRGQSDGLNKGFARTTGDILTWVNSDDLLEPGALFRVAQAFTAHGADMVAGGCRQIGLTRDHVIVNHHSRLPFGLPVALPLGLLLEMDRFWLAGNFFYQPEVFFSRDIWNRSGGRLRTDLNYVLDYDLWVRMAAAGATVVHIPDFLACSRTHEHQKTTVGFPQMPEVQRLLREYGRRLASPPPDRA